MKSSLAGEIVNGILLAVVVLAPDQAIAAASLDRTLPFDALVWFALVAVAIGIIFAHSELPGSLLHPTAMGLGSVSVLYVVGAILPGVPPDASWTERLGEIGSEIVAWYQAIASGGEATNNLVFLLGLAWIAWVIGYSSAWSIFHERSAWWPVSSSAVALALLLATFPNYSGYLLIELVAALLLVGRLNLRSWQVVWEIAGVRQAGQVSGRAFRASLALALAIVALIWLAPTALAQRPISQRLGESHQPWQQAQEQFHRMFAGLQAPNQDGLSGFGRAMALSGSSHLSDTPVMTVAAAQPEYWRAIVYDQYTGRGWLSSDPLDQDILPAGSIQLQPSDLERVDLTQQVTVLATRGSYLVGASQPYRFDQAISAQAFPTAPRDAIDLVAASSVKPLATDSHYTVVSSVSTASEAELRGAGAEYPAEVRDRYVPLPAVPDRVRQLAQQLTAGETNPYDQAVAVESYLRTLPYSLDLPPPPPDQDAVDYFLFQAKTGYCDYFASSMVVLLRSEGIPARVVAGYATGEKQADGSYLVKDSDSHAWVEVYFPAYGWIPFEPTGSWPRFARGNGNTAPTLPTPVAADSSQPSTGQSSQSGATPTPAPTSTPETGAPPPALSKPASNSIDPRALLPILYLLVLPLSLVAALWWLWEKDLRGLPPSVVAYAKMTRLATLLGFGHRGTETPLEYGQALARAVPEAGLTATSIAVDYARFRFGQQATAESERTRHRWHVVRNALLRRVGRLPRR